MAYSKATKKRLYKEYQRLRKNLKARINYGTKHGYIFDIEMPAKVEEKNIGKRAIKQLEKLGKGLYKNAIWLDTETGEIIPASERRRNVKRKKKEYYPTFNNYDAVRARIESMTLPQVYVHTGVGRTGMEKVDLPITNRKNTLLAILDDNILIHDGTTEYADYLTRVQQAISDEIDKLCYGSSDEEQVDISFAKLGVLLNMGALSPTQAESLHHFSELYYT